MAHVPEYIFKETNKVFLEYQNRLLEDAKKGNTILYLPSKKGKVYLAMLLIKNMGESLTKPLGEGRKWTFFISQSTSLAKGQAETLKNHLPWIVTLFNNDMNIKHWLKKEWDNVLDNCHIIIMTAEIFLNNLQCNYMNIKDANLIIFDECHLAVLNHPFSKIMKFVPKDTSKKYSIDEYPPIKPPRILGFTSTLIDSNTENVKEKLTELEQIFNATIKTKYEGNAQIFSERPECIELYDRNVLEKYVGYITHRINECIGKMQKFPMPYDESFNGNKDNYNYIASQRSVLKSIIECFVDLRVNMNENGSYVGYLATWHYLIAIIAMKKHYQHENTSDNAKLIFKLAMSEFAIIRKMLHDHLNSFSNTKTPLPAINNTSSKLIKFMEILSTIKSSDICLVIVDCEVTSKLLYHYIQDYYRCDLRNITYDFLTNTNELCEINSFDKLESHKIITMNEIIKKFNEKQLNILITSDVLEEDVLRCCNIVIRYDYPKNFLSYIQSKNKLASDGDKFIIMAPTLMQFEIKHSKYLEMEKEMKNILVHNEIDDNNYEDNLVEVFKTKCTTITQEDAINILNRYCTSLPQDRFTNLCPKWFIMDSFNGYKKSQLTLPVNSAIRTIDGTLCKNKNNAKKCAAFYACIELYKAEALDDRMLPMQIEDKSLFTESYWFPHWDEKDLEEQASYKRETMTHIESPSFLHGAYPCVDKPSYLHVIHCVPNYNQLINSFNEAVIKLVNSNKEFGILTSKKLPNITGFPIFLKDCDLDVYITVNVRTIFLNQENHKKLETFYNKLLLDVLNVNRFLCRNYSNENNSYLIVPIVSSGNCYDVDWNVVDINPFTEPNVVPTIEQRESMCLEEYIKTRNLVSQWYRNLGENKLYFVSDVKYDMTSESTFPVAEYGTYKSYFSNMYGINLFHEKQPLIKTQMLDVNNTNYLTPQTISNKIKTDLNQIIVPELCTWHAFPSDLWLKALMLPTILYRMNQLLLAEDLLIKIYSLSGRVYKCLEDTLEIDSFAGDFETEKEQIVTPIYDLLKYLQDTHIYTNTWNSTNMPVDIERNKNTIFLDVLNYHAMLSKDINHNETRIYTDRIDNEDFIQQTLSNFKQLNVVEKELPALTSVGWSSSDHIGLNQTDILKVITPVFIKDIINNKRLEICGDSFLHFAVSLVLFDAFKSENLQLLSELRTKIIGNRNLYSVGKKLNIEPYIMVNAHDPFMDWIPPCFNVPKHVKEIIEKEGLKSIFLYNIFLSEEEQLSGKLSKETMDNIQTELGNHKKLTDISKFVYNGDQMLPEINYSSSDIFLNKQWVLDKTVVQSVKSLIGTYVQRFGVIEGFKFLHNLSIIPKEFINVYECKSDMSDDEPVQSLNYSKILPGYEILENQIGYPFQNKDLLVQAFTHPSYQSKYTECHQSLGFLGGAILDFLITSYITDHCKEKTLAHITLIRSAIVNDCTFASISVRFGLHKFLLSRSVKLTNAIDRFYKHRLRLNHEIRHEVMYYMRENDCYTEEYVDVPNVLGDIFKSLIGALYLDCGRELILVWKICYNFLHKEIEYFSNHVIKKPLDILNEANLKPKFREPTKASIDSVNKGLGTVMQLDIIVNETHMITYGFGRNRKEAKNAVVKLALKNISKLL